MMQSRATQNGTKPQNYVSRPQYHLEKKKSVNTAPALKRLFLCRIRQALHMRNLFTGGCYNVDFSVSYRILYRGC